MLRIVNRVLLALTGVALFLLGLSVLVGTLDLPERWGFTTPSWWTWDTPDDVLLSDGDRLRHREASWWWPVVIGSLSLLVLLSLWWLLAQLRRRRLSEVLVDSGDGVGALLRGRAMEDVVAAETETLPGVDRARVSLVGRREQPRARVALVLAPQARPDEVVRRLRAESIEHAKVSAGLEALPAEARLRAAKHGPERVS
ncbi:alkaline shock response membrane anchor protein AmaP [Streptomyces sedi]|uniref:Alkaline shock response membrane anchor protein AmaP n=1 Tax=Streptomyces sedi TaxID=555059 RepID=A0A5C4V2T8_9ACTN|nr:alkaline shock response membrane anchor protein AmaP [Streptomyces sedi]TNM29389.1 alkaline shock response membrane anchor protein AmaP [Streptomyces sedi]